MGSAEPVSQNSQAKPSGASASVWSAPSVRALRRHLGYTQSELAAELGTRQATISEWEHGQYQPRGASARLLSMIAERAGFGYEAGEGGEQPA